MITEVAGALLKSGLIESTDSVLDVNYRWSHHLSLLVHIRDDQTIFSKVSMKRGGLIQEYEALAFAYKNFPDYIPEPLALTEHNGLQYLFTNAVEGRPLQVIEEIVEHKQHWLSFFSRARSCFGGTDRAGSRQELLYCLTKISETIACYCAQPSIKSLIANVASVRQHGDFCQGNILLRRDVPFFLDWEDFGEVDLAGFDVAMLLGSLTVNNPRQLFSLLSRGYAGIVWREIITSSGVEVDAFMKLLPVYYGAFHLLKKSKHYRLTAQSEAKANAELFCSAAMRYGPEAICDALR